MVHTWTPVRATAMAVTSTRRLVVVCHEHKVRVGRRDVCMRLRVCVCV